MAAHRPKGGSRKEPLDSFQEFLLSGVVSPSPRILKEFQIIVLHFILVTKHIIQQQRTFPPAKSKVSGSVSICPTWRNRDVHAGHAETLELSTHPANQGGCAAAQGKRHGGAKQPFSPPALA